MDFFVIILFLAIGIPLALMSKLKTGTYLNYGFAFVILWTITGILANTGIYGIYLPSTVVNISMLIGTAIFGLIYFIGARNEQVTAEIILEMETAVRTRAIMVANAVATVFMLPFLHTSLRLLRENSFAYLRAVNYAGYEITGRSTFINLILENVCYSLFIVSIILSLIMFMDGKRGVTAILIISIINMVIYQIIIGARNGLVIVIVIIVVTFLKIRYPLLRERIRNISKRKKRLIYTVIVVLLWLVTLITSERSLGSNKSIVENFYYYYFAGPSYLSQLLKGMNGYKLNRDMFWGSATLGFIYNVISMFLNLIGIRTFDSLYTMNSVLSSVYLNVSNTSRINAMATVYFPFLMDFGYAGIVIGPIIFSVMSLYIAKQNRKYNSVKWYAIEIFWFYVIYRSVFKWELISISAFFVFLFIFIFTKNVRKAID